MTSRGGGGGGSTSPGPLNEPGTMLGECGGVVYLVNIL